MRNLLDYIKENGSELLTDKFSEFNNFLAETRNGYNTNRAPLYDINETNARNMLKKHTEFGYIVISPCRGFDDFILSGDIRPEDKDTQVGRDKLNHLNQLRIRKMIAEIKASKHSYTPVYGGFIENVGTDHEETVYERSFVIYNKDRNGNELDFQELYELGLRMCRDYNQDSFLVQFPEAMGGELEYIDKNGDVDSVLKKGATFNDISKQYFTDLHKYHTPHSNSKSTRISFDIKECVGVYVNPAPGCYSEGHVRWLNGERVVTDGGFI